MSIETRKRERETAPTTDGSSSMLVRTWEKNKEEVLQAGRIAIDRARAAGVPAYYRDRSLGDGIVKEMPDGTRLLVADDTGEERALALEPGVDDGTKVDAEGPVHGAEQAEIEIPPGVRRAVGRLVEATDAHEIILFGSRARGDHHEDSDWDICVVLPDDAEPGRFTRVTLYPLVSGNGEAIEVHPLRRFVFEAKRQDPTNMSHEIHMDGVTLYRRAGHVTRSEDAGGEGASDDARPPRNGR